PGVLVTLIPRWRAVFRSIWSTPVPKEAMSFSRSPAWERTAASILSVTVGTSTSQDLTASISRAWVMGVSDRFRRTSNSSIIRGSTGSGSLRVTTTTGLMGIRALFGGLEFAIASDAGLVQAPIPNGPFPAKDLTARRPRGLGEAMRDGLIRPLGSLV